jgi:hypothetical protein
MVILLSSCSVTKESISFIPKNNCKDCEEFLKNISFLNNDSVFRNNSKYCIEYFLTKGDVLMTQKMFLELDLYQSILYFKKALEIDTSNQEVTFKIAYLYDLIDSSDSAKYYYNKVNQKYLNLQNRYNEKEFPEIDVNEVKINLLYNDSLVTHFIKYGRKASITFDYEYDYSNASFGLPCWDSFYYNVFTKKIYLTIFGNGEFESRGCYEINNTSELYFKGKLTDSLLIQILKNFEDIRFLTFQNLFDFDDRGINRFWFWYAIKPLYTIEGPTVFFRISLKTPDFNNSICVLDLTDENGPWNNVQFTNYPKIPWDKIKIHKNWIKLYKSSKLWDNTFNYDLLKYKRE